MPTPAQLPRAAGALVIGASQAGLQLAASLREQGWTRPVTLVGAEPHEPYQRPPLSKSYLAGEDAPATLRLRKSDFYTENRIDLVLGERIVEIDLASGRAATASGRVLGFGALALATGARVRRMTVPGSDLDGIFYLRDLDDADALAKALAAADRVVVVGGGFIGLEAAAVARKQGKNVTVIEATPRLVSRVVAPPVADFLTAAHRRRGTAVLLGLGVTAFEGSSGQVTGVRLDDGSLLPAQLVVVGIGVTPRTELAEQLGLEVTGGVVVDAFARASDPRVVAAGDCTVTPHPLASGGPVRLESVANAQEQARVAAATLAGRPVPYAAVPWFWSDQGDLKLQIAGLSLGYDDVVVRGSPEEERFSALYYCAGRLIAADCVNQTTEFMTVRRALAAGLTVPPERAADTSVALKELVLPGRAADRRGQPGVRC